MGAFMSEPFGLFISGAYRKCISIPFHKVSNRFWQFVLKKKCGGESQFWYFILFPITTALWILVSCRAAKKGTTIHEYLFAEKIRINEKLNDVRKKLEEVKKSGGAS
jgi:hypothetical protein